MNEKILVVEDEEDFTFIVKNLLEQEGYVVKTARNGEEGLGRLGDFRPDLILLDWSMPVMNGEAFCQKLRQSLEEKHAKHVPVVFLTVRRSEEDEMEALHFGADDFISKPFEPQNLLSRIRAVLRRNV